MKLQTITQWHKILGMIATLLIILLSVTGFMLLHTEDLKLQDTLVENQFVLEWYEISPGTAPRSYSSGGIRVTQLDKRVYFENKEAGTNDESLIGIAAYDGSYLLAYQNTIDLVTEDGVLIERLSGLQGVPGNISRIGTDPVGRVYLNAGDDIYIADAELGTWKAVAADQVSWSTQSKAPAEHYEQLMKLYRGTGLPLERVIVDLHSGRILGTVGTIIVDIAVLIFLALSFTGWWGWYRRRALQKEIDEEF